MPVSQPPDDSAQRMRIAPHLDLEHTKLTPTEPDPEPGVGAAPRAVQAPRSQRGNRALWFLALAAAALVASIFLREVRDQTQAAVNDSGGVSSGSVLAPRPAAEPDPSD